MRKGVPAQARPSIDLTPGAGAGPGRYSKPNSRRLAVDAAARIRWSSNSTSTAAQTRASARV